MKEEQIAILNLLHEDSYVTGKSLSEHLNVSEKTIRSRIKELNDSLNDSGARIDAKPKFGYRLEISDKALFESVSQNPLTIDVPQTIAERIRYIICELIEKNNYIKIDDFAEELFVSRNIISSDLKKAESILKIYGLELERRPNYGIRLIGNEFSRRLCLVNNSGNKELATVKNSNRREDYNQIRKILETVLNEDDVSMSDISLNNLVDHIALSVVRIKEGYHIKLDSEEVHKEIGNRSFCVARKLSEQLEKQFGIKMDEGEVCNIAIHLAGKLFNHANDGSNVISIDADDEILTDRILDSIYDAFGYSFKDNFELRMSLVQHLVPLKIRIKYGIPLENPLLTDLKRNYPLSYALGSHVATILSGIYHKAISEDEVGYLALIFQYAFEKNKEQVRKKNIVIVCVSGKAFSRLVSQRYRELYGEYIGSIYECSIHELTSFDFNDIDYVFSTVDLNVEIEVPVIRIDPFPEKRDDRIIREISVSNSFDNYFDQKLFFTDIHADSKEEVLRLMCQRISSIINLPDVFYDLVLKRENYSRTDLGVGCAIPHPYERSGAEQFIAVSVLPEDLWWGYRNIRIIFLLSLSADSDDDLQEFFKNLTDFAFDRQAVKELIDHPEYNRLLCLLKAEK